jgi:hypothetical protein
MPKTVVKVIQLGNCLTLVIGGLDRVVVLLIRF